MVCEVSATPVPSISFLSIEVIVYLLYSLAILCHRAEPLFVGIAYPAT